MPTPLASPSLPRVLVVDDDAAVRASLVAALQSDFAVVEAASVVDALAELLDARPTVVVLDLVLGSDSTARLHQTLARDAVPVLLVTGADYTNLPKVAEERNWPFLAKPFTPEALRRRVQELVPPPRAPTLPPLRAPTRPSKVPEEVAEAPRALTPPDGLPAAQGTRSDRVEVVDMVSRRMLRGFGSLVLGLLIWGFELRGHAVPGTAITAITLLGFGPDALVNALKKKPAVAGGGAAALLAVAVAGDIADLPALEMLSALGASSLPVIDELSRATRG